MLKQFTKLNKIYLFLLLLCSLPVAAKQSDKDAPIKIWADTFFADKKNNLAIYSGNVKFEQGSIKISCERLEIIYQQQQKNKIQYIIMQTQEGSNTVATFEQLDDDNQLIKGSAKTIEYKQLENLATLQGNAELRQANNTFKAESMVYNTLESRLTTNQASKDAEKNRVFISIEPEAK